MLSILGLAVIGTVLAGVVYGPRTHAMMQVGVGYVAHHMCACQHIAGRGRSSCRADLMPEMSAIESEALGDRAGVRATLFGGLIQSTAVFSSGAGCTLQ